MRRSAIGSIAVVALTTAYAAMAADLAPAYKASPIVPSVPWTWTGLYLGGHIGNGWGQHVFEHTQSERETAPREIMTFSPPETLPISVDGLLAGTQLGYRYQSSPWVWGVEGDLDWTDIRGGTSCGDSDICQSKAHWLATIAGEIGWTADHALLYLKGGGAAIQGVHSASPVTQTLDGTSIRANFCTICDNSESRWGWLFGAGFSYAFTSEWSAFVEYNYMDFGKRTFSFSSVSANGGEAFRDTGDITQTIQVIKAGLNYQLGWFP